MRAFLTGLCVSVVPVSVFVVPVSTEHQNIWKVSKTLEHKRPGNGLKWLVLAKKRVCINVAVVSSEEASFFRVYGPSQGVLIGLYVSN